MISKCQSYLILLFISFIFISLTQAEYTGQVEMAFKTGNIRDIGRVSLLQPLWQKSDRLLFGNIIGMMDNQRNQEGNFGLGYRQLMNDSIAGAYAYYDIRKNPPFPDRVHQLTLGAEWLKEHIEFRVNGYLPISDKKVLGQSLQMTPKLIGSQAYVHIVNRQAQAVALRGMDVEIGGKVPYLPLDVYGAYYYFEGKNAPTVQGPRLRAVLPITNWLSLAGEIQHDKPRGVSYFAGFELKFGLGGKTKQVPLTSLQSKMTQMPVRDIDVVVQKGEEEVEVRAEQATLIRTWDEFQAIRDNLQGIYLVLNDLDASSTARNKYIPIGLKDIPFQGVLLGAEIDQSYILPKVNVIRGLTLEGQTLQHIGLFSALESAYIGYLSLELADLQIKKPGEINTDETLTIGALAGLANRSTITQVSSRMNVTGSNRIIIGGIVGKAHAGNNLNHSFSLGNLSAGEGSIIGGIIGLADENNTISYSYSTGNLNGGDRAQVGGIVGWALSHNLLTHNYSTGQLRGGKEAQMGGIVGLAREHNDINYNYSTGSIIGSKDSQIGGVVGACDENNVLSFNYSTSYISGGEMAFVGGIAGGALSNNTFIRNFSMANIIGEDGANLGSIVGLVVENNFLSHNFNGGKVASLFSTDNTSSNNVSQSNYTPLNFSLNQYLKEYWNIKDRQDTLIQSIPSSRNWIQNNIFDATQWELQFESRLQLRPHLISNPEFTREMIQDISYALYYARHLSPVTSLPKNLIASILYFAQPYGTLTEKNVAQLLYLAKIRHATNETLITQPSPVHWIWAINQ